MIKFWKQKKQTKEIPKFETFARLLVYCDALEFFGIARLVHADLVCRKIRFTKNKQLEKNKRNNSGAKMKNFDDMIKEVLDCFCKLNKKEKENVLAVLEQLCLEKGVLDNGTGS